MKSLDLTTAQAIIDGALAHGTDCGARPLAVVVLDAGGHPVAFARQDGASLFRHDIARAKALGALGMGVDTRVLAERAAGNPAFFQSVAVAVGGAVAYSPGGVLLRDREGDICGAVGISGDTGDCDEACALAAIAQTALSAGAGS